MSKIPVGLQLYSVRDECAKNLPYVLESVAKMGYEGVEFAGYYNHSAEQLRKLLDDNGLKCCGTHVGIHTLLGEELQKSVDFNLALGNRYLIVPSLGHEYSSSPAAWRKAAETMNSIAAQLKPHDLQTGYHNHHTEFVEMDGELPWDIFFGSTVPEVVMQFDVGNAMHGGGEAAPFLKRYPGRAHTVHVKEYSKTNPNALVGEGDLPWEEIFTLCETIGGTKWYIVEQETYSHPPLQCVELCLQSMRRMGR